jgi:Concanavalin A-like lectin/glucanases superfamily
MDNPMMLVFRATDTADSTGSLGVTRSMDGSTWSPPAILANTATAYSGPSMTRFMGRLYIGYGAVDAASQKSILVTSSSDNCNWQSTPTVVCATNVASPPGMAAFQGKLHAAFCTQSDTLALISSYDGVDWPASGSEIDGISMAGRPGMAVFDGKLYIAYCNADNIPTVISSPDGVIWGTPVAVGSLTCANAPSLSAFKGKLYLAFLSPDTGNTLVMATSADGTNWTSKAQTDVVISSPVQLCEYRGKLFATFRSPDQVLGEVYSTNGSVWTAPTYTHGMTMYSGPGGCQGLALTGTANADHPPSASTALLLSRTGTVSLGQPAGLADATSLTAEIWVNVSTAASVTALSITGGSASFTIDIDNGIPTATATIAGMTYTVSSPTAIAPGDWTCIALTYDGASTELVLYIEGVEADAEPKTAANPGSASYTVDIGPASGASGLTLQGEIGRLLIWSAARSAEDVMGDCCSSGVLDPVAEPALEVYIDFSLAPVVDQSGTATPIQYLNGAQSGVTVPGLYLDGGTAYACAGTASQLDFAGNASFTIDGWFYPPGYAPAGTKMLVSRTVDGTPQYQIAYVASGSDHGSVLFTWGTSSIGSQKLPAGRWYHFAAQYDASTEALYLYINGNLQASLIVQGSAPAAAARTTIGAADDEAPRNCFVGYIQGVRFWKDALDQNEIREWLFSQPVLDARLCAAYDFSVSPPVDTTDQTSLALMGDARVIGQFTLVEPGSPLALVGARSSVDATYENQTPEPADPAPAYAPATPTPLMSDSPFELRQLSDLWSEACREAYWQAVVARLPANVSEKRLSRLRRRFEAGFAKAERMVRDNPRLASPVSHTVSDGIVRVIYHAHDGDAVLFEGQAAEVTPCQIWWMSFVATIVLGLVNIVLLLNIGQSLSETLASRLYNLLIRNSQVLTALYELIDGIKAGAGAIAVFTFLGVLASQHLLWSVLKLVLPSLGWWALGHALIKMIVWLAAPEAAAAATLATVIVWVAQISTAVLNYSSSCSPGAYAEGEEACTCKPA